MIQRVRAQEHESEGQKRSANDRLERKLETVRLNYFSSTFSEQTFCFPLTINQHKHLHKENFSETNIYCLLLLLVLLLYLV